MVTNDGFEFNLSSCSCVEAINSFGTSSSGSGSMCSFIPSSIAAVISSAVISNSISPAPSMCTFFGTQATIAAGGGADGFPKSDMNSNTFAPAEITSSRVTVPAISSRLSWPCL
nr:hypothetical protein Iba_chr09bCG8810 [Ipomoea batatas]